jgi:uncharacterized small protein (DUF1192 family)
MKAVYNYHNAAFARTVAGIINAGKDPKSKVGLYLNPAKMMEEQSISAFCKQYEYKHEKWASAVQKNLAKLEPVDGLTTVYFKNTQGLIIKCTSPYTYTMVIIPNTPPKEVLIFWTGPCLGPEFEHAINQIRYLMSGVPTSYQGVINESSTLMVRMTPEEVEMANKKGMLKNNITPMDVIKRISVENGLSTLHEPLWDQDLDTLPFNTKLSNEQVLELESVQIEVEQIDARIDRLIKELDAAKAERKNVNKHAAHTLLQIFNHRIWQ